MTFHPTKETNPINPLSIGRWHTLAIEPQIKDGRYPRNASLVRRRRSHDCLHNIWMLVGNIQPLSKILVKIK